MIYYKVARTYDIGKETEDLEKLLNEGFEPLGVQKMDDYIEYILRKVIPEEIKVEEPPKGKLKKMN